jgi:hypothetical protein
MSFQRDISKTTSLGDAIGKLKADIIAFASSDSSDLTLHRNASRKVNELRKRVRILEAKLSSDPTAAEHIPEFRAAKNDLERAAATLQAQIDEAQKSSPAPAEDDITQEQLRISREENEHMNFIQAQTDDILVSMRVLNDLTRQVGKVIESGHNTILRIDPKVADARTEMIEGNKELEKAERHQEKTCQVA